MKILVTGATGFIATQIVTDLIQQGHEVTCCARNTTLAANLFPSAKHISCDFVKDDSPEIWVPRLKNIDVVINCVGIFHNPRSKIIWKIHYDVPKALFDACVTANIKTVIQISALGVDLVDIDYANSKCKVDNHLLSLPLKSIVVRPSLVYGPGAYGGTSLFRGLVGLPAIIPVPGTGMQEFQPIHIQDLSKAISRLIKSPPAQSQILNFVSDERVTLREILLKLRAWLGFSTARIINIPLTLIGFAATFGNWLPDSTINNTAYKMLARNNISSEAEAQKFAQAIGFSPRVFSQGVYSQPSSTQDRWHSRLYFLRPLLQLSIAFIWLYSAICSLFLYPKIESYTLLALIGVSAFWQPIFLYGASGLDAFLGLAILFNFRVKLIGVLQILLILFYTAIITWKLPQLWLHPFAPIAKNIPLMVSILIYLAIATER